MLKGYIPKKEDKQPPNLIENINQVFSIFDRIKNAKQEIDEQLESTQKEIIETVDDKLSEVDRLMSEVETTTTEKIQEIDNGLNKIDKKLEEIHKNGEDIVDVIKSQHIANLPQLKGEKGESPDINLIINEVIDKVSSKIVIPTINETEILKKLAKKLPKGKASLKIIQEKIETDPMSVIDKIMALPEEKFKLKTSQIDGLEQTISAFRTQLSRGYLHGGGISDINGLITAGTNVTITGNGTKTSPYVINATGGGSSPLTTKGDLFTFSTLNTRLPVGTNGQVLSADSAEVTGLKWINFSGLTDGDKGDITVSGGGITWTIDDNVITNTKLADVATATFKGRTTAGTGDPEDLTVAQAKTLLNLAGINTGDQTSIVGITGTKAQFDTAVTDGNFLYVGDITQYTDEMAQDAVGTILTDSPEIDFVYNDATPSITASIVAGSIDETKLDTSVNTSLDLADTAVQPSGLTNYFLKTVDDTDDITVGAVNKFATTAEKTKLGFITVTQAVDLDIIESDTAINNAKVTNATHTGDATGSGALTVVKIQGKDFPTLGVGDDQKYPKYDNATNAFIMTTIAGGGDMVLASAQTNSGLKTFLDATLGLRNVANTFTSLFTNTNTAARTYTLPNASGIIPLSVNGNTADSAGNITIAAGGVVSGQATVNFGANTQEDSMSTVTVATASVTTTSKILVTPAGVSTADHDPDDYQWDNISGYVTNIINGVSFDIVGIAPNGSWGQYVFNYIIS